MREGGRKKRLEEGNMRGFFVRLPPFDSSVERLGGQTPFNFLKRSKKERKRKEKKRQRSDEESFSLTTLNPFFIIESLLVHREVELSFRNEG